MKSIHLFPNFPLSGDIQRCRNGFIPMHGSLHENANLTMRLSQTLLSPSPALYFVLQPATGGGCGQHGAAALL